MMILISVFDSMGHMMLQFMISSYALDLGIAESLAAILVSLISISSFLMRPVAGKLADSLNKKWLLLTSLGGLVAAMVLYLLSTNFVTLMAARLIHGLCYSVTTVASITIVGRLVPNERLGSGISIYGMGNAVSVIFATKIGQIIYGVGGAHWLFTASLFCAACAFVLALLLPLHGEQTAATSRLTLHSIFQGVLIKKALPYSFMNLLFSGSQAINSAFMVVYFNIKASMGESIGDAGVALMIWGIAIFLVRPLVGRMYDKLGFVPTVSICMTCSAIYMVVLGLSSNAWVTYLFTLCVGGFGGCSATVVQTAAYAAALPTQKGAANSTNMMGSDIGAAVGGVIAGWSVTAFAIDGMPASGYQISYVLCALPLIVAILFAVIFRKSRMMQPAVLTDCG